MAGTVLGGRYRIVELLGRGGMGEVYRALDLKLGQPVALKFLPLDVSGDEELLARFHNEVRIARQVTHANVCRVYDIGESDGQTFLSMEYIDGEDLASLLRRIGRLPSDKAIEMARQLCAALASAHDKGVLHRDLKPANVMIDSRGKVHITDFGLAGLVEQIVGAEVRAGTPAYMAPEQLTGKDVSIRSDLYSLGLVLYEVFVGKPVFKGSTLAEILKRHEEIDSTPQSPATLVDGIDPAVERIILRCLEKDSRRRPASALAVAAALPGGDPLAAALAAGETPSPELLASAGEIGGLRPAAAWALLISVFAGLALFVALVTRQNWMQQLSAEASPEVLVGRSREVLRRLGYPETPVDTAYGWRQDNEYMQWVLKTDSTVKRWDALLEGRPAAVGFWFRQSPHHMLPVSFGGFDPVRVSIHDPPEDESGMATVLLDPHGRLQSLRVIPPQVDDPAEGPQAQADWEALFKEAGFDLPRFKPVPPRWFPLAWGDARSAWEGTYPERPDLPIRVEAAAYRGRPILFRIIKPWTRAERMQPIVQTTGEMIVPGVLLGLFIAALVAAGLIARQNLRTGRGDRKGAFRLAMFVFVASMIVWILGGSHVPLLYEIWMLTMTASWAAFLAVMMWVMYIALEPYVRRRWPVVLIAWSRLVSGRFRDPLVGRDLFVGCAAGVALGLVVKGRDLLLQRMGLPPSAPGVGNLSALLGLRSAASTVLELLVIYMFLSLTFLFVLFLLRSILRYQWLAATVFVAVISLPTLFLPNEQAPLLNAVTLALIWGSIVFVLLHYGFVAIVGCFLFIALLFQFPATSDLSAWYWSMTMVGPFFLIAVCLYAFWTSLAGQPLFKGTLFQE